MHNSEFRIEIMNPNYNPQDIEVKWQKRWADEKLFATEAEPGRPKYYVLEMFPYPSGRIHMGHVRNYAMGDVVARYRRARGMNVLHPMGWDAFGMPAENAAMQNNTHPAKWTYANIDAMRAQLQAMGLSLDWSREIATCDPSYYKHQQKLFLDFLRVGLVTRKKSKVNWDPVDMTTIYAPRARSRRATANRSSPACAGTASSRILSSKAATPPIPAAGSRISTFGSSNCFPKCLWRSQSVLSIMKRTISFGV